MLSSFPSMTNTYEKSVGKITLSLIPPLEAFALPIACRISNAEAHAYMQTPFHPPIRVKHRTVRTNKGIYECLNLDSNGFEICEVSSGQEINVIVNAQNMSIPENNQESYAKLRNFPKSATTQDI